MQGLHHIEAQVNSIEDAVSNEPGLAFDLAKTLVESACRTILKDLGVPYNRDDELPKLFRIVTNNLQMLPAKESQESEVRKSIAQTLGGLSSTIQGIAELRNRLGFASHGSEQPRPAMEAVHAILAAQAADAIIGFIYGVHAKSEQSAPDEQSALPRDSNFDQHIDDSHEAVQILDSTFFASDILFQMEPDSYRIFLTDFLKEDSESEEEN